MWAILLACFSLLLSIQPSHRCEAAMGTCPEGWMTYLEMCYGLFQEKQTWREAERDCRGRGAHGHLGSILDELDSKYIAIYINSSVTEDTGPIWIGMTYNGENYPQGAWWWTDGHEVLYKNWIEGSPNIVETEEYCAYLVEKEYKYWKETDCNRQMAYLCKYELTGQRR